MTTITWIVATGLLSALISLVGAVTLRLRAEQLSRLILPLVSFAAGALLGSAFFHMLPEVIAQAPGDLTPMLWLAGGFIAFLLLERQLHHPHSHEASHPHHTRPVARLILIGDGLHNLIDGLAVGGAFAVDTRLGLATWLAAAAHELPQELGDFGVLVHSGFSPRRALLWNALSSLTFLVGALAAYALSGTLDTTFLISFAAGTFIYIAAADLIPEMNRHAEGDNRRVPVIAFLAGLGAMLAVALLVKG